MKLLSHEQNELDALAHMRDYGDTEAQRELAADAIVEFFRRVEAEREAQADVEHDIRGDR